VVWLRRAAVRLTTEEKGVLQHIKAQFPEFAPYKPKAQTFGDTCVFFHRLYPKEPSGQRPLIMPGIMMGFAICARVILQGLAKGYPLRGAVEVGVATDVFRHEVYGPALIEASRIEQEEAHSMRVVIGRGLRGLLNEAVAPPVAGVVPVMEQHFARRAMSMLVTDTDDALALDFLGQTVRAGIDERMFIEAATQAHRVLMSAKQLWRDDNPRIADKYRSALAYFATRGHMTLSGEWTPHLLRDDKPWFAAPR